ncbi:MAG: hypothetical protein ACI358_06810 [Candidatus Limimorpha sp.]
METVFLVMMILVCFNYILKQTNRKFYSVAFSALVCAVFVGVMWRYAIEQSKSQISDWLADSSLMLDIAVILTLEVAIQMAFCVLAAHIQTTGKVKPITIWIYRLLRWFPGVLIFPVLFSFLVTAIFAFPGISFQLIAWVLAAIVFVSILLGTYGLKWLLPEKEIRLELLFLSNALIAILGVIATVNGQTAVAGSSDVDLTALAGVALFVIAGLVFGTLSYNIKLKKIIKNK